MTNTTTTLPTDKDAQDRLTISKLEVLKSLLSVSIPIDEQQPFGEGTKYQAVFQDKERNKIKAKIMTLVDQL